METAERMQENCISRSPPCAKGSRIRAANESHEAHPILHLQRTIGNQAVQRLLKQPSFSFGRPLPVQVERPARIQAKLTINTPGDSYEQEADRISQEVMNGPHGAQSALYPYSAIGSGHTVVAAPIQMKPDSPEKKGDCSGWEGDCESFCRRAARQYWQDIGVSPPPVAEGFAECMTAFIGPDGRPMAGMCHLRYKNGVTVTVARTSRDRDLEVWQTRANDKTRSNEYSGPVCGYRYSCKARQGNLVLEKKFCYDPRKEKRPKEIETESSMPSSIQRSLAIESGNENAPQMVQDVLNSPGSVLAPGPREFMESRFGLDFAGVRMHNDEKAARSARSIDARAYTMGNHIVFGEGQFDSAGPQGLRLLAHELTHVIQQQRTPQTRLARQPAKQPTAPVPQKTTRSFETHVAILDRENLENWGGVSYWLNRVGDLFQISIHSDTAERFKVKEEQDAILEALWRIKPEGKLRGETVKYLLIHLMGRAEKKLPGEVLDRFVFSPGAKGQPKDLVTIYFESENPKSIKAFAPIPPAGYDQRGSKLARGIGKDLTQLHYRHSGFPQGGTLSYWEHHHDEERQLFYWIEMQGRTFTQIVVTRSEGKRGKAASVRHTSFLVRGSKDRDGHIIGLEIELLGRSFDLTEVWLQRDYHRKDGGDILLEKLQDEPHPVRKDHLGKVTLGKVPADEAMPLKYTIWGYFNMGTRDAEVDTTITTIGTEKRVFYTLRFRQNNDVDVERIGEEKTQARLDPNRMDVALVKGYETHPDDPQRLKAWLGRRYPGIKPEGQTEVQLHESANRAMEAESGKPDWFKSNYDIHILDADKGKRQLMRLGWQREQLSTMKDFSPEELKLIEISLQSMSETFLRLFRGTRLVRQGMHFAFDPRQRIFVPQPKTQGMTLKIASGGQITMIIFDGALVHSAERFLGGATGVRPLGAMAISHEFGHVVAFKTGAKARFNRFVREEGIGPFTRYAEENPEKEFFEEAFFLYSMDPEWLKANQPKVFQWFEAMN